jgi:hypothetical protein
MNTPLILDAKRLPSPKEVPLALTGLPKEINGQPVHYFRKEIARAGHWTHRGELKLDGTPVEFDITPSQMDAWVENFKRREENGLRPFVPGEHRAAFNAADNHGYVIGLEREGESAYATIQLIGDEAVKLAAKNDVSIYITEGSVDAHGNKYGEALEHLALTPNPNQPKLGPFVKIAASASGVARDVPVFEPPENPTPAAGRKDKLMSPELIKQFRETLAIAADVPDDKLPEIAAQKALSLSADASKLTTERDALKQQVTTLATERDAKHQEVLQLSADRKRPDDVMLSMFAENIATKREMAVKSGAVSEAEAKGFDALLAEADGKPSVLALSACGPAKRPFGFQLWDAIAKLGGNGIRTGNQVPRGATPAEPNPYLRLSADGNDEDEAKMVERTRKEAEEYRKRELAARGITA